MSSKPVSWGEVIKRRQQNKSEKSQIDTTVKEEENKSCDSPNENSAVVENEYGSSSNDNSLYSTPDFMFTGNTVVCQVLTSV